jgi:ketosteroid isomerase-like protein
VPQEWVDGGDTIVMLGRVTVRLDGRESSQSVAHVWKFQDSKITRFESFQDTLATARILGTVA